MNFQSISFRAGFLPYQKGFAFSVVPAPFVQFVRMNGPSEIGLPLLPQTQFAHSVFQSRPARAFDGYTRPNRSR